MPDHCLPVWTSNADDSICPTSVPGDWDLYYPHYFKEVSSYVNFATAEANCLSEAGGMQLAEWRTAEQFYAFSMKAGWKKKLS